MRILVLVKICTVLSRMIVFDPEDSRLELLRKAIPEFYYCKYSFSTTTSLFPLSDFASLFSLLVSGLLQMIMYATLSLLCCACMIYLSFKYR